MKTREKVIEVPVCDRCDNNVDYPAECTNCGKAFCYECRKIAGKEYQHGVYTMGSGDGFYCAACEHQMLQRPNKLYFAFLKIQHLRAERAIWDKDFEARRAAAEKELSEIPR